MDAEAQRAKVEALNGPLGRIQSLQSFNEALRALAKNLGDAALSKAKAQTTFCKGKWPKPVVNEQECGRQRWFSVTKKRKDWSFVAETLLSLGLCSYESHKRVLPLSPSNSESLSQIT